MNDKTDIQSIISRMTLHQKAKFCSGKDFWNLEGFKDLGIPSIMITDGPHGLRKQIGPSDHAGLNNSVPATCFPSAVTLASSWDTCLAEEVGRCLGEECLQENVAVLLGPGANIKRSPLCGRNFEYFSEDPFLSGKMAAAHIRGVQSKGVGTSLKHFTANNQEYRRMSINAVIDERALREIYLTGFEIAVKEGKPETVMNAYNRLNSEYCSENKNLLSEVLKDQWGFEGLVVTDWGAVNDRVKGLLSGLDLEMPGPAKGNTKLIVQAVQNGKIPESTLDKAVERILKLVLTSSDTLSAEHHYDEQAHHGTAKQVLCESVVLLKNKSLLPLEIKGSLAIIGEFAKKPRYQGAGSSLINPTKIDNAWDAIKEAAGSEVSLTYSQGYDAETEAPDQQLIAQAALAAKKAEIAVVFAGLPEISESEGFDRKHLDMPEAHNQLIRAVAQVNPKVVVVLSNGAPVTMPWLQEVDAVLESYLGGQAWGSAVADLLFGNANPSGKLAESFPLKIEDISSSVNYPGGTETVAYAESVYVGYRYYDKAGTDLLFPFGYGLSYTSFEYSRLSVIGPDTEGNVKVSLFVTNTGMRAGKEIVQVYVSDVQSAVFRPEKELKAFAKVHLDPGESREVDFTLDRRAFCFWDTGSRRWALEAGDFQVLVGASSKDIRLKEGICFTTGDRLSQWAETLQQKIPGYYKPSISRFADLSGSGDFSSLLGHPVPPKDAPKGAPFTMHSTLYDMRNTFIGGIIYKKAVKSITKMFGTSPDKKTMEMMYAIIREMPLKNLATMGSSMSMPTVRGLLYMINGHLFRGLSQIIFQK
ncbi:MAG: glycoside hydrolase family 3 C-terminal domain-containing protein [Spirochaetia bacterium]